uniref:Domain of unknown function with conserved HDNR motif domain-containing protein n=1 Tax=Leptobrachium leishanense TaxID=445787 RepID=A0A8C5QVW3_9ANUR
MPGAVTGSWFPSGFHGNFRGHLRNDFYQEYRKEATPQPPHAFLQRMKEAPMKHAFSQHDNRHIFPNSVFSFENGMGRKRLCKTGESISFIHWTSPEELTGQRPLISTYRKDFWTRSDKSDLVVPQLLVPRFRRLSASLHPENTTYRQMVNPTQFVTIERVQLRDRACSFVNGSKDEAKMTRRGLSAPVKLMTVSDCLVWPTCENPTQNKFHSS